MRSATNIITERLQLETDKVKKKPSTRRLVKSFQKKIVRNTIFASCLMLSLGVFALIIHYTGGNQLAAESVAQNAQGTSPSAVANPLDQLSSADIAVQVSRMTGVYEATSVANLADSQNAQVNLASASSDLLSKPQIIATSLKSRKDIVKYVVQSGDTISSLAVKYGVTSDSIRWSNSLANGGVSAGMTIYIPPINGIVYTVKAGDTATSLAQAYNADAGQIIAFNDAEISGLQVGEQIVIPNGTKQVAAASSSNYGYGYTFGYGPVYGYNGYDYGYCTWWAAQRRAQVGEPVPANLGNAYSWLYLAQAAGIPTGSTPQTHAVIWFGYYANHVAFVEGVNADGSITISEMNRVGWGVVDTRTLSASEAAAYKYIY